eukprot:7315112-Prymnesium_polylepis.1
MACEGVELWRVWGHMWWELGAHVVEAHRLERAVDAQLRRGDDERMALRGEHLRAHPKGEGGCAGWGWVVVVVVV